MMGVFLMCLGGFGMVLGAVLIVAGFDASAYTPDVVRLSRISGGTVLVGSGLGTVALGYLIAAVDTIKEGILRMSPAPDPQRQGGEVFVPTMQRSADQAGQASR
jgi:hypothetical protein